MAECNDKNAARYPSWKWLLGIALLLIAFLGSRLYEVGTINTAAQMVTLGEVRAKQQLISERVSTLEGQIKFIVTGIERLEVGQKEIVQAVAHDKRERAK